MRCCVANIAAKQPPSKKDQKEKARHFGGAFPENAIIDQRYPIIRLYPAVPVFDPAGSDLAVAVRASGRRLAAGPASVQGSDFAGRDSGSD
jgi:hypothetical protein